MKNKQLSVKKRGIEGEKKMLIRWHLRDKKLTQATELCHCHFLRAGACTCFRRGFTQEKFTTLKQ